MPAERKQPPAVIAAVFANPVDQELVTGFLAGLGYQPVAFSADSAPKADLFILDAPSARRFGEPVLERKRATEIFLPAIIALGQEAPVDPWLAAGFDETLRLPFTKSELAHRVEILLRARRQSQALAQSAEARYQALFENAPVGIGVSDQQGRLLLFNQAMLAPGGYTPEDIEQMQSVADLYYDPQQRQAALEKFRVEGRLVDFRVQFKGKDGRPYDALLSLTPITYQGKPCIQAIVQDITEQVRAEQALRESEERWRFLSQATTEGIVVHEKGRIVDVNEAGLRMVGYSREELIGQSILLVAHPDSVETILEKMRSGSEEPYESVGLRKDGTTFPCELRPRTLIRQGRPARVVIIRDLSEQKQAEQALQRYSERLEVLHTIDRAILAAESSEAIAQAALRHIRKLVPCRRASVADFSQGEAEAVVLAAQVNGETHYGKGTRVPLEAFGLTEKLKRGEIHRVDDLAHYEPKSPMHEGLLEEGILSFANVPILAQGELIGMLNVGADRVASFTEEDLDVLCEVADPLGVALQQARLREQLQRHADELEQRVAERTRDLEESNKALEDFAYSVSHDLRAPLRAISGFAEIIARRYRESLDEEGRHYFDNILEAAGRMGELITDLLEYSRLVKGVKDFRPVPLTPVIEKIVSELQAGGAASDFRITVDTDLSTVLGTATLLRQVFSNLIGNALKFRRDGVEHRVEVRGFKEGPWAVIEVVDNGIGIAPEYLEKIFNIFQRLHSQDDYPGTGIGLAIVKKAVALMGGTVEVESEPGKGSLFRVKLKNVERRR